MKHENMEAWRPHEDQLLVRLIKKFGTRWHVIQRDMPHRTISSIRNRFSRIQKGRTMTSKNRCTTCGRPKRGHTCGAFDVLEQPAEQSAEQYVEPWANDALELTVLGNDTLALVVPVTEVLVEADDAPRIDTLVWETILAARDMGFDRLVHPPTDTRNFSFHTSTPLA